MFQKNRIKFKLVSGGNKFFPASEKLVSLPYDPTVVAVRKNGHVVKLPMSKTIDISISLPDTWVSERLAIKKLDQIQPDAVYAVVRFSNKFWTGEKIIEDTEFWNGEIVIPISVPLHKD